MNEPKSGLPKVQALRLIWMAMCVSVLVYGLVAFLVSGRLAGGRAEADGGDPFANPPVIPLHLAGFAAIVAGFVLPGVMLRGKGGRAPDTPPPMPGMPFVLSQPVMQAMLARFALSEAAAVMGLVLAFVTRDFTLFVALGLASLSALLLSYPSEERLRMFEEAATRLAVVVALIVLVAAPTHAQPNPAAAIALPSVELPAELDRVLRDYETAWRARDAAGLAKLFADDGYVLSHGRPPVRGRAAIAAAYAGSGGELSLRAFGFGVEESSGYIIGGYAPSEGAEDTGKFVLVVRKSLTGRWVIVADIDNRNSRSTAQPVPQGATAPAH